MLRARPIIAVIDNSIQQLSLSCLNRLVENRCYRFTYHIPSFYGIDSLLKSRQIDGMIILGSNSNVSDRLPWQKDLAQFAIDKLHKGIPVLGICFGHQLMADAFGSTIDYVTEDQQKFSGRRDVTFIKDVRCCFKSGEKVSIGYAHQQEIKILSSDLVHLATSDICRYEVVTHKKLPFLGTQGHPEADIEFIETNMSPQPSTEDRQIIFEGGTKFIDCFFEHFHKS